MEQADRGHLFACRGDVMVVRADFFVVPTDRGGRIEPSWRQRATEVFAADAGPVPEAADRGGDRAAGAPPGAGG